MLFPKELFVTGTDTMVGKTFISSILCAGLKASYWKPIQSGLDTETDTAFVQRTSGLPASHFFQEGYSLNEPLSPHASARIDGVQIELSSFRLPAYKTEHLIVEGAGGLMVPINDKHLVLDIIKQLQLPVLIVAHNRLGTINHTLLTVEKLRANGVTIFGIVLNGPKNEVNREAIEHYGKVQVLAELEPVEDLTPSGMATVFDKLFGGLNGLSNLASVHTNENGRSAAISSAR